MTHEPTTSWAMLVALGAFHGINPGMGWLFAVALGMQERRRGAVIRALLPLGVGHALAVAAAVAAALAIGAVAPIGWLQWTVAGVLVSLGAMRFVRHRHRRWAGMRVGMGGLTLWSFLMATAHGAGLMLWPALVPLCGSQSIASMGADGSWAAALAGVGLHSAAMLATIALIAALIYEWVGLAVLRNAWVNIDLLWVTALEATGVLMLLSTFWGDIHEVLVHVGE